MSDAADLLAALAPVAAAFRRLGVRHFVGGSVASTIHGAIRSTMDVDLVCELRAEQAVALHGPALDLDHMRRMAESVGVGSLLERLLAQPAS